MQIPCMGLEQDKHPEETEEKQPRTSNIKKSHIVVPYMKGLAESCKNICRRYGVEVYFKGGRTIRDLWYILKTRTTY